MTSRFFSRFSRSSERVPAPAALRASKNLLQVPRNSSHAWSPSLLGHHADGLPLLLQVDELVAGGLPVGRVLQGLRLLDEGTLLVGIHLELLLEVLEELRLASEEVVTGSTEALEYLDVHLLGCKADGLPLCLQFDNLLGATLPVCAALVFLGYDGFDFLAEGCLLGQVLLFLGAQIVVVLLETLVDSG